VLPEAISLVAYLINKLRISESLMTKNK